jgi:protein O-GlcNAc transferase
MEPDILYGLVIQSVQQGKYGEAVNYLKEAIRIDANNPFPYALLGEIYEVKNEINQAVYYYKESLALESQNAGVHFKLANLLREQGNLSDAINHFKEIIKLKPDLYQAFYYLADTLADSGDLTSAIDYYNQAIKLNPESFECFNNLGNIMIELGDLKQAMEYFQEAHKIKPDLPQILNNIGFIYGELKDWQSELEYYEKAIQLDPGFTDTYHNLAVAYEMQGKISEAKKFYQKVLDSDPGNLLYKLHIETICPVIPFSNEEIDNYRNNLAKTIEQYISLDIKVDLKKLLNLNVKLPDNLAYQGRDELEIRKKYAEIFAGIFPISERPSPFRTEPDISSQPKIGFVVTKDHEGIFCRSMKGILNNLSGDRFNITLVYNSPSAESYLKQMLTNPAINFLLLKGNFVEIIQTMADQKFDLLYYWEVDTDILNYFLPFCRLAPVQCTSWGWQVTTGIPNMDYYISSELVETAQSNSHYSEKLYKVKTLPVYYYRPDIPAKLKDRSYFGFTNEQHIYLCSQNLRKIHPDFDRIIGRILSSDKNSVLLLINDKRENISEMLKKRISHFYPDIAGQIKFMPRMNYAGYLNLVSLSDVVLDTIYYGGVNTTFDALACGTPVVTMPTQYHRGRFTYGIYKSMGIFDCVANTEEEYINLALKIAGNPEYRAGIVTKIKENDHLIFENKQAISELVEFFEMALKGDV